MNPSHDRSPTRRSWRAAALALPLLAVPAAAAETRTAPALYPVPRQYREHGADGTLEAPGRAALVIGARASDPERYAAERLQAALRELTGAEYAVVTEDRVPAAATQLILLGQPSPHENTIKQAWGPIRVSLSHALRTSAFENDNFHALLPRLGIRRSKPDPLLIRPVEFSAFSVRGE